MKKVCLGVLAVLICIVGCLRFYKLTYEDLWLDEVFDLHNALRPSLYEAIDCSVRNNHSPLDIALLFYWIRMFKDLALGARLLYAVIGMFAVIAFFWFCRLINERGLSLFPYIAALFFGLSEQAMYYSREVRSYIFVLLFSILSFGFYIKVLRRGKGFSILFYVLFSVLLLYSHFFAVLVLVVHNVFYLYDFFVGQRKVIFPIKWFFIQTAVLVLYLPLFLKAYPVLLSQFKEGLLIPGVNFRMFIHGVSWVVHPGMLAVDRAIRYLLCFFIAVCVAGMLKRSTDSSRDKDVFVLLLWAFIPPVFLFILSKLVTPVFATRYFITSLAPLLVLSVRGYFFISGRLAKIALLACLLALYAVSYNNWFIVKHKERYKDVFSYIDENRFDDRRTIVFFNPGYFALPILFHLDIDEFKKRHTNTTDIMEYLNNRDIYTFDPQILYELLNSKEPFSFFTLENRAGGEDMRQNLNRRIDIHKMSMDENVVFPVRIPFPPEASDFSKFRCFRIGGIYIKPFAITQYVIMAQENS